MTHTDFSLIVLFVIIFVVFYGRHIYYFFKNIKDGSKGLPTHMIQNGEVVDEQHYDKDAEKGSAFMTMESLRNPILFLSPKRRKLTENYLKSLSGGDKNNMTSSKSALDILNRRYANGEINEEEYLHMKKNIE